MAVQTWEYVTQLFNEMELQQELDDLGSAGWELVTAHWEPYSLGGRSHMQARCILKRPVPVEGVLVDVGRFERLGIE